MRVYVGLASTVHDPAIAFVDEAGEVRFAEAVERAVGYKRAWHVPPDEPLGIGRLLDRHAPAGAQVIAGHSWRRRRWRGPLFRAGFTLFGERLSPRLRPTALGQMNSFDLAGRHLEHALHARGDRPPVHRHFDHHLAHAALACFGSPFDDAACAVVDANGERASCSTFAFEGARLTPLDRAPLKRFDRNGSLGVFYSALCVACGFDPVKGEEWKVMGLAPYGRLDEALYRELSAMIRVEGLRLVGDNHAIVRALAARRRTDPSPLVAADLAFTGQRVFTERMVALLTHLHRAHPSPRLVLSGGGALNSACNGQLLERTPFRELWVPSAPADDGNAVGAAWLAWQQDHPGQRPPGRRLTPFLGSGLMVDGAVDDRVELTPAVRGVEASFDRAAELLAGSRIVAVARGRAELGPRALGNRSILADPRDPSVKATINDRVKRREAFRPFAPAILHEHGDAWFEGYAFSPYMERALRFREEQRARVPGVVHEDGTGRLQSVTAELAPNLHAVLSRFFARTGVPILLNTSFNVMGKPIAHSVEDALAVFFTSGIDALLLEDRLYEKPPR